MEPVTCASPSAPLTALCPDRLRKQSDLSPREQGKSRNPEREAPSRPEGQAWDWPQGARRPWQRSATLPRALPCGAASLSLMLMRLCRVTVFQVGASPYGLDWGMNP